MLRDLSLVDDFTPFGYLQNPAHRARAWGDVEGGDLRTAPDVVGLEWAYPVGREPQSRAGLVLRTAQDDRLVQTRADFDALGLTSRHHSVRVFGFDWQADGVDVAARYVLVADDALAVRVEAHNRAPGPRDLRLEIELQQSAPPPELAHVVFDPTPGPRTLSPGASVTRWAVLGRGASAAAAEAIARQALAQAPVVLADQLRADAEFATHSPLLTGDWPPHWRAGLHYDLQTTRLLVRPPGGIFHDVWPTWMAAWPRVVLAEGTLDMLRLAYVEPDVALRAVASLFRDAPAANVPCVFEGGEFNMVAADGSRCGTSPAWCLPFLNLELLYLRTLDRDWLAALFPRLVAFVDFWLAERTDPAGWLVYRCTWEAGEDGNPRLDPSERGDADISGRVRPVELQATMAHAAGVMARLAAELGGPVERWRTLEAAFRARTLALYDAAAGRFRDWLIEADRFADPCPDQPYWGVDAGRYAPQSLTPLLLGAELPASEIELHLTPPWTLWPSWTWTLVESLAAAGHRERVGELALATIDRVYRATTRRELGSYPRPLPGTAPEFWPTDWRTYEGNDAYGWGATTANLLLRHLLGLKEAYPTDTWTLELAPAFPPQLRSPGARYTVRHLTYRGVPFDLTYTWAGPDLVAELDFAHPCTLELRPLAHTQVAPVQSTSATSHHSFRVANHLRHLLQQRH